MTHYFPDVDGIIVINGFLGLSMGKTLNCNHYLEIIPYPPYPHTLDSLNHGISELVNYISIEDLPALNPGGEQGSSSG